MAKRLTDLMVEQIKTPAKGQVTYWDVEVRPFGLRVGISGKKAWVVMPRVLVEGKWKASRIVLGHYEKNAGMSLKEAREKARAILARAEKGEDVRQSRKDERKAMEDNSAKTFGVIRDRFIKRHCRPNLKSADQYEAALKGRPFTDWEARALTSITRADVLALRDKIADGYEATVKRRNTTKKEHHGGPVAANRTLAYLKAFFGWCVEEGHLDASPADRVKKAFREQSRERVLLDDELTAVWKAASVAGGDNGLYGAIVRLLALTGQRRMEVAGMLREELDLKAKTWTIGSGRTKNGEPHVVPLAPQAVAIIEAVPLVKDCPFVFSIGGKRAFSNWTARKRALDTASKVTGWTLHDLRRTVVTGLHESLGIEPHVVEAIVNHVSGPAKAGVAGTYNRALYLDKRRTALEAWANHVDGLLAGKKQAANVTNLADHRKANEA